MAVYQSNMTQRPFVPSAIPMPGASNAPPGTFLPGTKVQVGNHRVIIDKYLSEGGFAHVYVVSLPRPVDGKEKAVLKRVAVPDKELLANMRNEVETMKRLRGHKYIVKYIDSHASSLQNGGYEVFLLMEWCNGGGLIDFMNTRLQNRLTEPEIIKIFTDVSEGVAAMHYLKPALMHRDLKVENVLISTEGKNRIFKLCDFGSAAPARPAATNAAEGRLIEDDVQRHTTLQYRSPEMIDVYRKQPIDEKSDIWALGCFLYKLCYYTTPFEEVGQMAILNASFKYPGYPRFSDELKLLIASMLQENPTRRPNIYQVLAKACKMDGRPLSLKDSHSIRSQSEDTRKSTTMPSSSSTTALPGSGASLAAPKPEAKQLIPEIEPMRRGRPIRPISQHNSAKPSPSPLRMIDGNDAFASLDVASAHKLDELSQKYPKLEEFSLMSDPNANFAFQQSSASQNERQDPNLAQKVTQALADDAFARPASPPKPAALRNNRPEDRTSNKKTVEASGPRTSREALPSNGHSSRMVSTGTGTSPPLPPTPKPAISNKPIWRVPEKTTSNIERASSITQASSSTRPVIAKDKGGSRLASLLEKDAAKSQPSLAHEPSTATSSRPSLEGGRPLLHDVDSNLQRSKSLTARNRPVSVNMGSHPTHIGDTEIANVSLSARADTETTFPALDRATTESPSGTIDSDLDYLRAREEEDREKNRNMKRLSTGSRHQKRSSLPSAALSGTKNILQGRFGEAFRRFESHGDDPSAEDPPLSPDGAKHYNLTPIAGSEATDLSDDRRGLDETEELSPELRRELEKQKLEAEERRVERAAAEYRSRVNTKGNAPPQVSSKAASIQNRVQSLLQENNRPATKTATGYGRFTRDTAPPDGGDVPAPAPAQNFNSVSISTSAKPASVLSTAIDPTVSIKSQRPTAPPKPQVLRTGNNETPSSSTQQLGVTDSWEDDFSKKYPDLSNITIVETKIQSPSGSQPLRMKEI